MERPSTKKLIIPDDLQWFILFLCSRWGKSKYEIEQLPVSEIYEHWHFWKEYRWGMNDDLLAMQLAHAHKLVNSKSKSQPWMIKLWTTQRDYTYRTTKMIIKPVAAIRSGFMAIVNAIKGLKDGSNQHS